MPPSRYVNVKEGDGHLSVLSATPRVATPQQAEPNTNTNTTPTRFDFASLDNVVMSPHRGGAAGVAETETRRMRELARMINRAVERGGPLQAALGNRVCVGRGY